MVSTYSLCSEERSESINNLDIPSTPFIGVRISWLMEARNSLFALVPASASSRAFSNSAFFEARLSCVSP